MTLFSRDQFADPELHETGIAIADLGRALVLWRFMQRRQVVTVADAAAAFNTSAQVICEAADAAPYLCRLAGPKADQSLDLLELDGE